MIKPKRALGLAGCDVISGKKNFKNPLNKRRFLFRKDVEVDFFLSKHANAIILTGLLESMIALVLS